MAFTEEQQIAIDVTGKAIVSASAGSGKTTVMIAKIIKLILNGAKVSEATIRCTNLEDESKLFRFNLYGKID
jgi:ATP-dependent exoDNAse (exonuclease V) beta subunit